MRADRTEWQRRYNAAHRAARTEWQRRYRARTRRSHPPRPPRKVSTFVMLEAAQLEVLEREAGTRNVSLSLVVREHLDLAILTLRGAFDG